MLDGRGRTAGTAAATSSTVVTSRDRQGCDQESEEDCFHVCSCRQLIMTDRTSRIHLAGSNVPISRTELQLRVDIVLGCIIRPANTPRCRERPTPTAENDQMSMDASEREGATRVRGVRVIA